MRPAKLTMRAFGSYARETEVDFDRLDGGLYLIVGKTGAGKTTIFDAISFALFGRPSGSERTAEMLHSDFAPMSEDTVVGLDFRHQDRAYHVERRLHFPRRRGTEDYGDPVVSAVMTGEGQDALEGATRVTARCEALLGLNAEQFRRIVMLAQGEFREFLHSGSDKKNEILGRLFDNAAYLRYQNLLCSVRDSLRRQRAERESELSAVMETLFRLPEDMEAENFLPGHPRLIENLQELTDRDAAKLAALETEREARLQAVEGLTRQEGAAEADNALLAELEEQRRRLAELEGQAEAFAARQRTYQAAELALHRVKPWADEAERARALAERTERDIADQALALAQAGERLEKAWRTAEADGEARTQAEALAAGAAALEVALPGYQSLAEREAALAAAQEALNQARASVLAHETQRTALGQAQLDLRAELKTLEGCEAEAVRLERDRDEARARWEALTAPEEGIADQTAAALAEERALAAGQERLRTLTLESSAAEERYHALFQAFLQGQAGRIAADLERELTETGRAACPVCGSVFHAGEQHAFALAEAETPRESEVKEAEALARKAEHRRRGRQSELEQRRGLLAERKEELVRRLRRLEPDCGGWEAMTAPDYLPVLRARLERELSARETAWADARARCDRRARLLERETEISAEQADVEALRLEETERCETLEREAHGLRSALEELRRQLPFPDRAAAQAALDGLRDRREALLAELEAHAAALARSKEASDRAAGGLKTLRDALPARQQAVEAALARLALALAETGFSDLEAARTALSPLGETDGERWLLAEKEAQDDYVRALAHTRERIGELTARTQGKTPVDLEELRARLEAAREHWRAAADAATAQRGVLEGHRQVLETAGRAKAALAGSDRAYRRVNRLAELGVGVSSEVGRLSFDRYVMGAIFREVLDMANRRLDVMTGGRFTLLHAVDAGRRNAVAGLEIEVLDAVSGSRRPSGSISGGEGFMVSLALALGLSDVVQAHAGGQRLDALFIDEGFGTLDDGRLDQVISVLQQLTEGNRLVGVISHVDKLEESIPQKLRVTATDYGSTLALELS